jgi:thymidylate kinase
LLLARQHSDRFVVLDAARDVEAIHRQVRQVLEALYVVC